MISASNAAPMSLAARRRWETQVAIAQAAADLFLEQGYEPTTVQEIAGRAGIGVRTFYRHCLGKDDVFTAVIARNVAELALVIRDGDPARPLSDLLVDAYLGSVGPGPLLPLSDRLGALLSTLPQLRVRRLITQNITQEALAPALASRLELAEDRVTAHALAAVVTAATTTAVEFSATTGTELRTCLEQSLRVIEPALTQLEQSVDSEP